MEELVIDLAQFVLKTAECLGYGFVILIGFSFGIVLLSWVFEKIFAKDIKQVRMERELFAGTDTPEKTAEVCSKESTKIHNNTETDKDTNNSDNKKTIIDYSDEIRRIREEILYNEYTYDDVLVEKLNSILDSINIMEDFIAETEKVPSDSMFRRINSYYMPELIELLNSYLAMNKLGKSKKAVKVRKEIEGAIDELCIAIRQYTQEDLYDDEFINAETSSSVMKQMIEQDGYGGKTINDILSGLHEKDPMHV